MKFILRNTIQIKKKCNITLSNFFFIANYHFERKKRKDKTLHIFSLNLNFLYENFTGGLIYPIFLHKALQTQTLYGFDL